MLIPIRLSSLFAFILPILFFGSVHAGQKVPPGQPLVGENAGSRFVASGDSSRYKLSHNPRGGPNNRGSWTIATLKDTSPSWGIAWTAPTAVAVTRDDLALVRFTARATHTTHETGSAQLRVVVQQSGGSYAKAANRNFSIGRDWETFYLPARFPGDYGPGRAEVAFGFGFSEQTVEIADIETVYYGKRLSLADLPATRPSYLGREPNAPWRKAALERIERYRKGDLDVRIVDAQGNPVSNAQIELRQTRSAFEIGTAINPSLLLGDGPNAEPYRRHVLKLFNAGSPENDLKWPFWAGERGGDRQDRTFAALRWMQENDLTIRGHVLVWPGPRFLPTAITGLRGTPREKEIPQLVLQHIDEITTATRDYISEWDVINEPYNNHLLMDMFGDKIMVDWFKAARRNLPDVPLFLNDWGNHNIVADAPHVAHFVNTARFLRDNGADINGLGLQGHIGENATPPENLLQTLDHYQRELGLAVRITEFDITTTDEQMQADYTRDFLIAAYSHPTVVGVQFWGFWEGAHWRPDAALYRQDWTEKPNGRVLRELVQETWHTNESGASDRTGRWQARGFHGEYELVVKQGNRVVATQTFTHAGESTPVTVTLR